MTRTVVGFWSFGASTLFLLEEAPNLGPGQRDQAAADVSPLPGGNLIDRGTAALARLAAHPPVKTGLDQALSLPATAAPSPLYFHIVSPAADQVPWEEIYAPPHGFCALDRRWPVGRIAATPRSMRDRPFDPPLRIVAVLSAARQSGVRQLEAILGATAGDDAAAVGVHVHVISAEEAVLKAVDDAITAGRTDLTSAPLAGTASGVEQQIRDARPHLLHLLCHGGSVAGVRTVALATTADFDADEETGTVRLKLADLVRALDQADAWLVVLAACETAAGGETTPLAHALVDEGVPAVIGMRRLVDLNATNRFCAELYPEVLATIREAVEPAGPPGVRMVDWACVMTGPRIVLGGADPSVVDEWTDPVLYVQQSPLRVFPSSAILSPGDFARLRGQLDRWEAFLASPTLATAPAEVITEAEAKVAELRAALGPAAIAVAIPAPGAPPPEPATPNPSPGGGG